MLIGLRILMLTVIAGMFVFFIILLRKQKIELRYCLVWLLSLVGIAVFCIFPHILDRLSALLGIDTPVNTFFLICIAFLACICISLTVVVSRLSDRLRKLTQNIAISEFESKSNSTKSD
ncbi:MAG: DUF2304 domain-containing protein [Oscillospiraceae bacterium]|nr:DUF2304 domain-containing protein [Oscillospiraceae bacterium]